MTVGIPNCNLNKKYNLEEALCLLGDKVNELVTMYNRIDADHVEINKAIRNILIEIEFIKSVGLKMAISEVFENGLIVISDSGKKFKLKVSDSGALSTVEI